jgi:hypothetical protein
VTALAAADGLRWIDESGVGRIEWGTPDWLGSVRFALGSEGARRAAGKTGDLWPTEARSGEDDLGGYRALATPRSTEGAALRLEIRAYAERPLLVFRTEALTVLADLATGAFDQPSVAWPALRPDERQQGGLPDGTSAYGHLYAEFALPTFSDASLAEFFLLPAGFRPAVVSPLALVAPDGRTLLLAPLGAFHDQVIAVPRGGDEVARGVRAGWHGDLESAPAGFASELAVWAAPGTRCALEAWAGFLKTRFGTRRPSRYADAALAKLSYWTDNGAAYWYRTHAGLDMSETLERAVASVETAAPVGAVELDSWFYPHQVSRRVGDAGPDDVPPTGALRWEPREDVLPDGVAALRERLGGRPLILHARHLSSRSPDLERFPAWVDGDRAHPKGPELFDRWMRRAAEWGAIQVEQDWLVECFLGVKGLRAEPGRAAAWQRGLDRSAAERTLHLVWCMATAADFLQTLELECVAAIRTSGDYRYGLPSASLWCWFLLGNALARALGLWPFKDVFLSSAEGDGLDGDRFADVEALLAALSAGPVGLGDRIGRTDRERVRRTCRADGVLVKPDVPIAALDRCFRAHPHLTATPLIGETHTRHAAGTWVYLALLNAWREARAIEFAFDLDELGEWAPKEPFVLYDWRSGGVDASPSRRTLEHLEAEDWSLRVLCPLLPGDCTLIGDPSLYACIGDRRIQRLEARPGGGLRCEVVGAPGEEVALRGYSAGPLRGVRAREGGGKRTARVERDPRSGIFDVALALDERGRAQIELAC